MRTVLADPSRTVLKIVTRLLEDANHEVRAFDDGRKALEHVQSDAAVRALITSAELPSLSGIELCGEVRRAGGTHRPLYILLMSSSSDQRAWSRRSTTAPTISSASLRSRRSSTRVCVPPIASPRCRPS